MNTAVQIWFNFGRSPLNNPYFSNDKETFPIGLLMIIGYL